MHELLKLPLIAALAFASLFVLSKLMGKKQIAQLNFVDYVIGISLGSIAAEMAFDVNDVPFYYYLIAMAVFVLLALIVDLIERKGAFLKHFFKGRPSVLIYEGKLEYKTLKKSGLDVNDLIMLARAKGYFDINDIYYAILETNGELSILPVGAQRPAVAGDLPVPIEPPSLPCYLVIDGHVSHSGLSEAAKDENWLLAELKMTDRKHLKTIILASYDEDNDTVTAHYKNE